jgi:hypothetical protein
VRHGAVRRVLVVCVLAGAGVVTSATSASAHGLGGLKPTDYQTTLGGISPAVSGLKLTVVDLGTRLELTNHTAHDVTVLGYDGEPYLRVGPRGVYENTRSPATYFNKSLTLSGSAPPKQADSKAPPVWKKTGDGPTASWHDHRAHFMGTSDPPVVARDRTHRHVIDHFQIGMRTDGTALKAQGEIVWVPPPSPWPWIAVALVLAVLVLALSRKSAWPAVFTITLVLLIAIEVAHVVGLWGASTAPAGTKLAESGYSIAGILLAVLALIWLRRKGADAAVPLVLVATIFLFVAGGLADVTSLGNSELPVTFAPWFARLLVTATLGLGGGLAAAAALRLRPQATVRPSPTTRSRAPVTS